MGACCLTIMVAGITFATTEKQETDIIEDAVAVQKEQVTEQENAARQDVKKNEEECRKKLHKEMRDAVDKAEKERCQ